MRARIVFLMVLLAAACSSRGSQPAWQPAPEPGAGDVETVLFLVGDAGEPGPGDPVLAVLTDQMRPFGERAMAVFLGDNIYPLGLPDSTAEDRAEMERRLAEQIDAVLRAGGRGLFVPGNHDWIRGRKGGWEAILRQERFIKSRL